MIDIDKLHTMALEVTTEVFSRYPHIAEHWKVVLGGFILPEMAELDPDSVKGNSTFERLVKEYSKEKVEAMFSPKTIEVEKIVEVEV